MVRPILKNSTDQSVVIRIIDSTDGTPETGVEHDTSGIDLWYRREGATKTSITEAALAALDSEHSDGGIEHIGDGYYRLDLPNAAVATGANGVMVGGTVTGMIVIGCYVPLVDYNPYDGVRMGMTALPNAAAEAAGGLYTRGTGAGQIDQDDNGFITVDVLRICGGAQTATDLKDFADTGYNPATHHVAYVDNVGSTGGYVTVGTNNDKNGYSLSSAGIDAVWDEVITGHTTANTTGKALTDALADTDELQTNQGNWATAVGFSTHDAADVVNEWETQSQADPTGFHVNVMEISGSGQRAIDLAEISQYLIANSVTLTDVIADNSIFAQIMAKNGDISDYVNTTDSLEGLYDGLGSLAATTTAIGDYLTDTVYPDIVLILADTDELQTNQGNWATAVGFSTHDAADVVNEWETQSQADPTGFHVNVMEVGGTAQTANDNGADINAILTDTDELQTDWVNGGRLDLLLDAVSTHDAAGVVTALMADTGITAGGTMTFETWCKVVGAAVAGDFKDKDGGGYELFDVEDGTTVIFSQTISETTPYRDTTME